MSHVVKINSTGSGVTVVDGDLPAGQYIIDVTDPVHSVGFVEPDEAPADETPAEDAHESTLHKVEDEVGKVVHHKAKPKPTPDASTADATAAAEAPTS